MFGRKKKNHQKQDADTEAFLAAEKERKEKEHADLLDRYKKAIEYDRRVAAGEDPDVVEEEVYKTKTAPVKETVEEAPVEEVAAEEDEVAAEEDEVVAEEDEVAAEEDEVVAEEDEVAAEEDEVVAEEDEVVAEEDEAVVEEEVVDEPVEEPQEEAPVEEETEDEVPAKPVKETKAPTKKASTKKAPAKKAVKKEEPASGEKVLVEASKDDKTNGKYEIFKDSGGFKYRLVASNGQVMANSEVYTTAKGAQNGIDTLKSNLDTLVTHIETDKHRKSQFIGCTSQNKVLVHSANYSSKTAAQSAIDSFKNFAKATKIVLIQEEDDSKPEVVDRSKFLAESAKGKFVILFNKDTLTYQFALKASNGQIIVTSKFYKSDVSCKGAISKFKNDVKEGTFYTVQDKNGQYQFRLYSASNRLVQSGISYSTKAKCLSNIESICRFIDSDIVE